MFPYILSNLFVYLNEIAEIIKTIENIIIVTAEARPNILPLPPDIANLYVNDIRISVQPTGTSLPITGGPPPESKNIKVKLLKLNAKDPINKGEIETIRRGNVILQKAWRLVAPSTFAASINSLGIDCSAPVVIKNMYGKPNHVFTRRTADLALSLVFNHLIGSNSNIS
tara:strand:+ start:28 stop:534 length:507 start_codon:yes stop_codon:yes gene_type:complete